MGGYPAFHVDKREEEENAYDEGDVNVRRAPAIRGMTTVAQRVDNERQSRHHSEQPPPIHHSALVVVAQTRGYREQADNDDEEEEDGADVEVPTPVQELAGDGADEDAEVKADASEGAVDAVDAVLARAGPVGVAEEGEPGGQEGAEPDPLHRAAHDQGGRARGEAGGDGPHEGPEVAAQEDVAAAVDVAQAREGQEEGGRRQVGHGRGPGALRVRDLERHGDLGQDDVEAADEVLAHHHGQDHGQHEAVLGKGTLEDGRPLTG